MDKLLLSKIADGDESALKTLIDSTYQKAFYTALSVTGCEQDAEDAVWAAYYRAYQNINTLKSPGKFNSWFNRIVVNSAKNIAVKKVPDLFSQMSDEESDYVQNIKDDLNKSPEEALLDNEQRDMLRKAMDDLNSNQKLCLQLYYFNEMSVSEIAQALDVSENTIKTRLRLGRQKLKRKLGEENQNLYSVPVLLSFFNNAANDIEIPNFRISDLLNGRLEIAGSAVNNSADEKILKQGAKKNMSKISSVAKSSLNLKRVIVIISAIVAVVSVIAGAAIAGSKVSVDNYIVDEIAFSGFNGYGKIDTYNSKIINYEKLYTDLEIEQSDLASVFGEEAVLGEGFDISNDANSGSLKNDDIVKYTITVDYDKINNLGKKKLKGKEVITKEYRVSGLKEATNINPFDAIEKVIVSYKYNSYHVNLQFNSKIDNFDVLCESYYSLGYNFMVGEDKIGVGFDVPSIANINAGDKITITLSQKPDYYSKYGIIFTSTSQEFSVLTAEALTSASNINQSSYNKAKALFEKETKSNSNGEYTFADMFFYSEIGNYTKTVTNEIIAVYKFKSNSVGSEDEYVYYYINSPEISSDGELVTSNVTVNHGSLSNSYHSQNELETALAKDGYGVTVNAFEKISF